MTSTTGHFLQNSSAAANGLPRHPKPLNSSSLQVTRSNVMRHIPELGSKELWAQNSCSDHMISVRWTAQHGWDAPELKPFGDITISPAASCLHYATQCFEGLKVYRGFDGKLRLFRPDLNARRLAMSARRVSLPDVDEGELVKLIKALVRVDCPRWLPENNPGRFLYIRPALIGNGDQIGIQIPQEATLLILMVAWPDFSTDVLPGMPPRSTGLRLMASENGSARAWPGGFGYAKVGANYGPSFLSLGECRSRGYDQILWVLGPDCQVTEAGASNFFVIVKNKQTNELELITPPLKDKVILEGVTRQSVLDLARTRLSEQLHVLEEKFTMHDLKAAWSEGRLVEAFVTGTAFFISAVSTIHFEGTDLDIPMNPTSREESYATSIKGWLEDIMYGKEQSTWGVIVNDQ